MPKPSLPVLLHTKFDALMNRLPPKLRAHWTALSLQKQRMIPFVLIGLLVFLLLWALLSGAQAPPAIVSARQLQMPTAETGTTTAITQSYKNFPGQQPAQSVAPAAKPDVLDTLNLTPGQKSQLLELRQNVDNIYKSVLTFPLDEAKMIVFAQAATKIDMINAKWDTLIAGAADDATAAEYLSSATLESRTVLEQSVGINAAQYDEIYKLSARDVNFNKIANAYKDLVAAGIWGPMTPIQTVDQNTGSADQALRFPTAPAATTPAAAPNPAATPAAGGIAPAP